MTPHYGSGVDNYKVSSSWVRRQTRNTQVSGPCAPDPSPFETKINWVRQTVKDYCGAKFQVIPISGFRFIVLTHAHTPTHILTYTHIVKK